MKLAEALQERKNTEKEIEALWAALRANLFRPADDAEPEDDPKDVMLRLADANDRIEALTVAINLTNNAQPLNGNPENTIMKAIARRDRLNRHLKGLQALLGIEDNPYGYGRHNNGARAKRTKTDDIKYVATINVKTVKAEHDVMAAELRTLDLEIQKANWTVDLIE